GGPRAGLQAVRNTAGLFRWRGRAADARLGRHGVLQVAADAAEQLREHGHLLLADAEQGLLLESVASALELAVVRAALGREANQREAVVVGIELAFEIALRLQRLDRAGDGPAVQARQLRELLLRRFTQGVQHEQHAPAHEVDAR